MGLRDKVKGGLKKIVSQLSGEYSAAAPEVPTATYAKPGVANEDAKVVMARLNRPTPKPGSKASSEDEG
jgi:hypothetical protein